MAYLLDSDWLIDRLGGDPVAVDLVARLAPAGLRTSVVSYMEAFQGTLREPDPVAAQARLELLVGVATIVPFTPAVARHCALVRETLKGQGRRVGSRALDLIIAATAIEHGLTLVSRNTRDYRDVPDLVLYVPSP